MNQRGHRLEFIILDKAPGFITDGCIGLPIVLADSIQLAALNIIQGGAFGEGLKLVLDHHAFVPLGSTVVIVSSEFLQIGFKYHLLNPPVKPEDLRLIFVHKFAAPSQPVIQKPAIGSWPPIFDLPCFVRMTDVRGGRNRRAIKTVITRILYVRIKLSSTIEKPPVLGSVTGDAKKHILF